MKKPFALAIVMGLALSMSFAQRIGYVNTEDIMGKIPEYQAAQSEIERVSQRWQKELEEKYAAIEQMYNEYQAQEVLLPEDIKQEKQENIFQAEREAKEFREKKFGYNGELFSLQESKVKPIQDRGFRGGGDCFKAQKNDFRI